MGQGEYVGNCHICGRRANYNTPATDGENIYCNDCAGKSTKLLQGIEQWYDENGEVIYVGRYFKNGVTLHIGDSGVYCWYDEGGNAFPLMEVEEQVAEENPEEILDMVFAMIKSGKTRCCICKKLINIEDSKRYSYAGVACGECWEKIDSPYPDTRGD